MDANHPDISSNFDASLSCPVYEAGPIDPNDPAIGNHGTTCAALAAAAADNGECSVGVAHRATISACRFLDAAGYHSDDERLRAYLDENKHIFDPDGPNVDINSNSWGSDACFIDVGRRNRQRRQRRLQAKCPFEPEESPDGSFYSPCVASVCEGADWSGGTTELPEKCKSYIRSYCLLYNEEEKDGCVEYLDLYVDCDYRGTLDPALEEAFARGVTEGRDGKGIIYTIAAGNEYFMFEDINAEGELNSRYTIA